MHLALQALNQLVQDRVVDQYAIGGAIGASFYIDAMQTEDIDAFVFRHATPGGLITLTPIYDALINMGGLVEREHVRFAEWPLQILPDANDLIREAIRMAIDVEYDGIPTRVFTAEHLCAVALQTGRTKDYLRVILFLEQSAVDSARLADVIKRHELTAPFTKVQSMMSGAAR